jgi:hypothetical protein
MQPVDDNKEIKMNAYIGTAQVVITWQLLQNYKLK